MTIYNPKSDWRKVYINHYGPIPTDKNGRKYDIHHIDGNRKNNHPFNLKAVTIEEHYDIHYAQGDYGACLRIAARMNKSHEELSELARQSCLKRIKNGTHPWLGDNNPGKRKVKDGTHHFLRQNGGSEKSRQIQLERIKNGTHPLVNTDLQKQRVEAGTHNFLNSDFQRETQLKLLKNGTHHFLNPEKQKEYARKRVENGTCSLLGGEIGGEASRERVKNGTHNFLNKEDARKRANKLLSEGRHPSQKEYICPHCNKIGKGNAMKQHHFDNCKYKT